MARTITQIQDEIIAEKNRQTALAGLDSTSRTSIWRLWTYVLAVVIHYHETLFDQLTKEIQKSIDTAITGTPDWYVRKLFGWQEGDQLQIIDNVIQYAAIDPAKQIIKRAAYENQAGLLILKAASLSGSVVTTLTSTQLDQVRSYLNKIKFAGTNIEMRSSDPDKVRLYFDIYYDGLLDPAAVRQNIYDAIEDYFENFNTSNFGGIFRVADITDAIQAVTGVIDVYARQNTTILIANGSLIAVPRRYILYSGYGELDDSAQYVRDDEITLTPAS